MKLNPAFFSGAIPHERKLTLTLDNGEVVEQVLYIRELTSLQMRRQILGERSEDQKRREYALAELLAVAICDENAEPVMSLEEAAQLRPKIAADLRDLVMEVQGMGKPRGSTAPSLPSTPSNGFGIPSPSPSEAAL